MAGSRITFRILGPLEVRIDDQSIPIGGPKQRALLALLLLSANRVVPRERLIAELFAEQSVNSADHALRNHVSRLRKALAPAAAGEPRLVARAPGYLLRVEPGELDFEHFEQLVAAGREAAAAREVSRAAAALVAAERLWEGRPLADLEFERFVPLEVERLEELRLAATEERIDAELALGRQLTLVAELDALTTEHPYRERFRWQLMLALYRSGRQAEGLEIYRRTRTLLNDELGLEPGAELQDLERAILVQDPALALSPNGAASRPPPALGVCPFKGLAAFETADADLFFGRERLVDELVARIADSPLLAIVGVSGSGKSSLLRAGLLATLAEDHVLLRPGDMHAHELADRLAAGAPGSRTIVAVDQFEELFAASVAEDTRRAFVDVLVEAAWDPDRRAVVLIALRADFFGRLAAYPELADLVGPNHVLLGPMGAGELRRAIEGPAERAGLGVEPTLVDALVSDVAGEPGGLPLLSTALIDLWRERDGTMLTFAAYEVTGGVRGAVGRHAEAAFRSLDADEQRVARRILLRLVAGGDAEALTRRRVQRRELDTDHDPQIAGVLAALVERRLVVADEAAVELVHEALLDQWPRLVTWIDEDVQGRRLHRHLTESATEWEAGGRDVGELFRGARLAATLEWAEAAGDAAALNRLERAFLEASRTAFARANRRLQALLALAVILLAAAVIAGIAALAARGSARNQATVAVAQRLGAQALVEPDLDRSLLLAREALRLDDAQATRGNLLAALLRGPAALAVAHPGGQRVVDAALDPTGRTLAVRANDGGVAFFRAQSLRRLADRVFTNGENVHFGAVARPLRAIAYSPDGRVLAAGDSDGSHATLVLIDAVMHEKRAYRTSPDNAVTTDLVYAVDGRTLVTGEAVTGRVSPPPARIVVRRASDGVALRQSRPIPGGRLVGFGPGGRSLVVTSGENVTYLLDVATFRRIRTFRASGAPALSPSRRLAVFGGASGAVRVADLRTGRLRTLGRTPGRVTSVSFGPGDGTFATGADDGTVAVWDTAAGLRETLTGLTAAVVALVFGRGGHTLYSGSADGTVVAWDVSAQRRLARPFGFAPVGTPRAGGSAGRGAATAVAVSSDGSLVATQPAPDRVTLWRAADMSMLAELRGPCGSLDSLAFSHDGRRLAGTGDARQTVVWNVGTRRVARLLGPAGNGGASGVGFSPDDRLVATAGVDGALRVYDVGSALEIATVKVQGSLQDVDFSADGKLLVAAGLGGQVIVWDVRQHRVVRRIAQPDLIFAIRMSPDGKTVVTGDSAGNVRFWDAGSGRRAGRTLGGQNGAAVSVTFDPTGTELVTTSSDGKVRLWDLQTAKLVGAPLDFSERGGWGWGTYFPDGKRVIAVFDSGVGVVWDVDPTAWARQACRIANRDLTRAEWHDFLPNRRPASVCGRFSAARA